MTTFDRQMQRFIDSGTMIPLRLIAATGLVQGAPGGPFGVLLHDSFISAYLDLDDLLAS